MEEVPLQKDGCKMKNRQKTKKFCFSSMNDWFITPTSVVGLNFLLKIHGLLEAKI